MTDKGYTIKEIADELGVSKQAVHQKRKSKELSTRLQSFTSTVNGVVYITVDGVMLLRQAFDTSPRKPIDGNDTTSTDKLLSVLETTIDTLQKELEAKNGQIAALQEQNAALTAALTTAQALHAGTIQHQLEDGKTHRRKRWFFGKNKVNENDT